MSESHLWKDMKKNIGHLGHFSRVESHETSSGIPDVDYCIRGIEGHVELKFARGKIPKIRGTQVRWFRDRVKQGGSPWLFTHMIVEGDDCYMLHQGKVVGDLARAKEQRDWARTAFVMWVDDMNWHELIEYLSVE